MQRRRVLQCIAGAVIVGKPIPAHAQTSQKCASADHVQWVTEVLTRMQSVKPGMTRADLLKVFTTEGGLVFSGLQRTFVSGVCPYFKVDVQFERSTQTQRDWGKFDEDDKDIIVKISTPYLQFSYMD